MDLMVSQKPICEQIGLVLDDFLKDLIVEMCGKEVMHAFLIQSMKI